ncbi:MAG TPA: Na+/H+ antiporter NhaA [Polyangiaceae bacterium]|nr:Na+/H+ antiporter NhaA [Polyangiaceae bacterium]
MTVAARARGRIEAFLKTEAASGVVLLGAAVVALALANSPAAGIYHRVQTFPLRLSVHEFAFERSLSFWVNDGLMVLFFFVVGLEIRREMHAGELSEWKRAVVPTAAALGGMVVPAAIYLGCAGRPESHHGWGVPMATDIAFAVGILALLGSRVPPPLRMLLLALAIIDDIGAILVIAFAYSSGLSLTGVAVALSGFGAVLLLRRLRVRRKFAYLVPALVTWGGTYAAGVHPTIAGVALGLVTPVTVWPSAALDGETLSPADQLIQGLHPWVAFGIMPLFALANAGVTLSGFALDEVSRGVVLGVVLGLVVGKPLGVALATAFVLRTGLGTLPAGFGRLHVVVVGIVAGVGFTMALFVAELAFHEGPLLDAAKLGILAASALSGVLTLLVGRAVLSSPPADPPPESP